MCGNNTVMQWKSSQYWLTNWPKRGKQWLTSQWQTMTKLTINDLNDETNGSIIDSEQYSNNENY